MTGERALGWAAAAAIALYLGLAIGASVTKAPFGDEGFYAAPSYTLLTHGYLGVPPTPENGMDRRVYSIPPLFFLTQAVWYRVVSFGVITMRLATVLWGLVLLVAFYAALERVTGQQGLAILAAGLLGADYTFLMSASNGRPDMMSAALGMCAIAVYLRWREQWLGRAVLASQTLVVLSGLTHPVGGFVWAVGLMAVTLGFDGRRVARWRFLALAAIPYLAGASAWGVYILQDPADFKAQFVGIALSMDRGKALHSPLDTLVREFTKRYWGYYGPSPAAPGVSMLRAILPLGYLGGLLCALSIPSLRARPIVRQLAALWGILALALALVDGTKQFPYLVHLVPPQWQCGPAVAYAMVFAGKLYGSGGAGHPADWSGPLPRAVEPIPPNVSTGSGGVTALRPRRQPGHRRLPVRHGLRISGQCAERYSLWLSEQAPAGRDPN